MNTMPIRLSEFDRSAVHDALMKYREIEQAIEDPAEQRIWDLLVAMHYVKPRFSHAPPGEMSDRQATHALTPKGRELKEYLEREPGGGKS